MITSLHLSYWYVTFYILYVVHTIVLYSSIYQLQSCHRRGLDAEGMSCTTDKQGIGHAVNTYHQIRDLQWSKSVLVCAACFPNDPSQWSVNALLHAILTKMFKATYKKAAYEGLHSCCMTTLLHGKAAA